MKRRDKIKAKKNNLFELKAIMPTCPKANLLKIDLA
jgi:hypothetical protein